MGIIELDNGYYIELIEDGKCKDDRIQNIQTIKLRESRNKGCLLLYIDFREFDKDRYKKILRKLLHIKKMVKFLKINIGVNQDSKIKIGYINNYDENNQYHQEFIQAINAILFNTKKERYNYIYDTVCNYLDGYFYGKNLCDFKDNQCGEKRGTTSRIGCCHHFRVKSLGPFTELVPCEHLKDDYTCGAKCISCKLFTCDYLEKKGVKFRIKDILLLDTFFNSLQKYFIKYMVFTPKDKIIKRLMITGAWSSFMLKALCIRLMLKL